MASRPVVQVHVPPHGPAEIAGIPIADSLLEQLRANASIEPVLVDDDGTPIAIGKRFSALSPKIVRAVLLRDGRRRCTDACDVTWGLQVHHLRPVPGVAPTTPPTSSPSPAATTRDSSPTAPGRWSATPTSPTASTASTSTTSPPNNANKSALHHRDTGPAP